MRFGIIIHISCERTNSNRWRNFVQCIKSVTDQSQTGGGQDYNDPYVCVVEQGNDESKSNRKKCLGMHIINDFIFLENPGPYNRSKACNLGAVRCASMCDKLVFLDADVLLPRDFFRKLNKDCHIRQKAIIPFDRALFLDSKSSKLAIENRFGSDKNLSDIAQYNGKTYHKSNGLVQVVDPELYFQIGGFNELFEGYGREDADFFLRLSKNLCVTNQEVLRLSGCLLHLHHTLQKDLEKNWRRNIEVFNNLDYVKQDKLQVELKDDGGLVSKN